MLEHFTIFGASGFVGSHLSRSLHAQGARLTQPPRDWRVEGDLGHVIYCIGMTADFRQRPMETFAAHIEKLLEILRHGRFDSLLYLSSTRVYQGLPTERPARETDRLLVDVNAPGDLYNITKLAGEAACLNASHPAVRVIRLSNVFGNDFASKNFLTDILGQALDQGRVTLRSALASCKDYVSMRDVEQWLPQIALRGRHRLYNLASGRNVTHGEICDWLREECGATTEVDADAAETRFPSISIERIEQEFDFRPTQLKDEFANLLESFRHGRAAHNHH